MALWHKVEFFVEDLNYWQPGLPCRNADDARQAARRWAMSFNDVRVTADNAVVLYIHQGEEFEGEEAERLAAERHRLLSQTWKRLKKKTRARHKLGILESPAPQGEDKRNPIVDGVRTVGNLRLDF